MPHSPISADPVPRHGYRGEGGVRGPRFPRTLTVAVSRQAGSRGGSIARRVGRILGWQVVDQDLMEFIARQGGTGDELSAAARAWAEERIATLRQRGALGGEVDEVVRVILTLGALGEVILVGRGSGHVLPHESTLHVRFVAPRADRVAYMSQWQRLTPEEAAAEVDLRDARRTQYLIEQMNADPADAINYDLVLNSSLLGEEQCAEIVVQAARGKLISGNPNEEPDSEP